MHTSGTGVITTVNTKVVAVVVPIKVNLIAVSVELVHMGALHTGVATTTPCAQNIANLVF